MKVLLYILLVGWFCVWAWIAIDMGNWAKDQIQKDKSFVKTEIVPNINLINNFKYKHSRLPSIDEFDALKHLGSELGDVDYIRSVKDVHADIKERVKDIDWSKNYVLAVWRGDWFEYYISHNNQFITNNTQQIDVYLTVIFDLLIGCLPTSIFLIVKFLSQKKIAVHGK